MTEIIFQMEKQTKQSEGLILTTTGHQSMSIPFIFLISNT